MSIYKNGKLIAGGRQTMPLLSFMWADHQLNHPSWLRADTFSWQAGSVYKAAYAHLADDFNSIPQANVYRGLKDDVVYCRDTAKDANGEAHPYAFTSFYGETCKTVYCDIERIGSLSDTYDGPTSAATLLWRWGRGNAGQFYYRIPLLETIAGTEIRYFVAGDGHKIVMANQESNVAAIYNATGVAWYYILDTANQRFKLPRSKHNKYADSLGVVGNGMVLGLKNSTQNLGLNMIPGGSLTAYAGDYGASIGVHSGSNSNNVGTYGITTDPEKSGIIAQQTQDTDQYKYLYFYVGQFTQTAIENTAGLNAELFNGKVDVGHQVIAFQAPTAENNYTWYRKYADGWVEQGGVVPMTSPYGLKTVVFPVAMSSTNFTVGFSIQQTSNNTANITYRQGSFWNLTTTSFDCYDDDVIAKHWQVSGMAA